jgi:glycine oxidase
VDPPSFLDALRLAAERAGAVFHSGVSAREVRVASGRARGVVLDDGSSLDAGAVVVAAGSWSPQVGGAAIDEEVVRPARGQILELTLGAPLLRHVVEGPGCYLSPREDGRVLVGSTLEFVGFRPVVTASAARDLLTAATRLVPALAGATLSRAWAGLRPHTPDELPLLGPSGVDGLVIATGHFRNGILLAPITGEIVAALLGGEAPPADLAPFSPRRFDAAG